MSKHICMDVSDEVHAALAEAVADDSDTPEELKEFVEGIRTAADVPDGVLVKFTLEPAPGESLKIDGEMPVGAVLRDLREKAGGGRIARMSIVMHVEVKP